MRSGGLPASPPRADLARFRLAYRCLARWFDREGAPLPDDLPGDDRPGPLRALDDDLHAWLGPHPR